MWAGTSLAGVTRFATDPIRGAATVLVLVLAVVAGCTDCDEAEAPTCEDGVFLKFVGTWDEMPGDYEVLVIHDGTEELCSFSVEVGEVEIGDCNLGVLSSVAPVTIDGEDVYLGGTPEGLAYVSLYLSALPESIELELRRDGETLVEAEVSPSYEGFKTNATRCHASDSCDVAVEEFMMAEGSGNGTESG